MAQRVPVPHSQRHGHFAVQSAIDSSASIWHYPAIISFFFPDAGSFHSADGFLTYPSLRQQPHVQALNTICDHVDDIESVLRTELEFGHKTAAGAIKRDAMARKLAGTRGKEVRRGVEKSPIAYLLSDSKADHAIVFAGNARHVRA